ncbi:hypothetical protein D3C71_1817020 [compost metagenome]
MFLMSPSIVKMARPWGLSLSMPGWLPAWRWLRTLWRAWQLVYMLLITRPSPTIWRRLQGRLATGSATSWCPRWNPWTMCCGLSERSRNLAAHACPFMS